MKTNTNTRSNYTVRFESEDLGYFVEEFSFERLQDATQKFLQIVNHLKSVYPFIDVCGCTISASDTHFEWRRDSEIEDENFLRVTIQ